MSRFVDVRFVISQCPALFQISTPQVFDVQTCSKTPRPKSKHTIEELFLGEINFGPKKERERCAEKLWNTIEETEDRLWQTLQKLKVEAKTQKNEELCKTCFSYVGKHKRVLPIAESTRCYLGAP